MTRKVKPLTGQVLIEVLPADMLSSGGIAIPEHTLSADEQQEASKNPEKPARNNIGIVRAIGPWPKLKNGLALLPEFGVGAKVVFNSYRGVEMQQRVGQRLRMMRNEDVLAVLG